MYICIVVVKMQNLVKSESNIEINGTFLGIVLGKNYIIV